MRRAAAAIVLAACAPQSARLVRPGHTQVSAGVTRISLDDDTQKIPAYLGEVRVAHGFTDGLEVGAQLARSAGNDRNVSALGLAPKIRLRESEGSAISLVVPAVVAWSETGASFASGTIAVVPSASIGLSLGREVELVLSPRAGAIWRPQDAVATYFLVGGAVGLSFGAPGRATLQPEVGFSLAASSVSTDAALVLGLGVTAGN